MVKWWAFFSLDQMLLQMYENPIAGEDWQTKNVTEENKAWFKKENHQMFYLLERKYFSQNIKIFCQEEKHPIF